MPLGQPYTVEGLLLESSTPWLLALHLDDGGIWQLDGPRRLRKHVGHRVQISGTRSGFNLIDVDQFTPV